MILQENLNVPIPYLIQKKFDFKQIDNFGWSLLHYAVGFNNSDKISELLLCDIDFNINSSTKLINKDCIEACGKDDSTKVLTDIIIPYCENGYTPLHLSVVLGHYYKNKSHLDYRKYYTLQQQIFENLLLKFPESIMWEDANTLTATDYCILNLNFDFLKKIKNIDTHLDSLNMVQPITAKKICENELERYKSSRYQNIINETAPFVKELVSFFQAKHSKDNLEEKLKEKIKTKSGIIKI